MKVKICENCGGLYETNGYKDMTMVGKKDVSYLGGQPCICAHSKAFLGEVTEKDIEWAEKIIEKREQASHNILDAPQPQN